eukprot:Lithocolla_globosa_v1_NODE_1363_length_2632_cov_4.355840.p2 type:complete len:100 gc:universal NODE_1363_length_2632_cov_4.355840:431-132(-)
MICFPVHKGEGLMIAGIGKFKLPSQLGKYIKKSITIFFVKKTSREEKLFIPNKESLFIPMIGLFREEFINTFGSIVSSKSSVFVSIVCGALIVISSPSN